VASLSVWKTCVATRARFVAITKSSVPLSHGSVNESRNWILEFVSPRIRDAATTIHKRQASANTGVRENPNATRRRPRIFSESRRLFRVVPIIIRRIFFGARTAERSVLALAK